MKTSFFSPVFVCAFLGRGAVKKSLGLLVAIVLFLVVGLALKAESSAQIRPCSPCAPAQFLESLECKDRKSVV